MRVDEWQAMSGMHYQRDVDAARALLHRTLRHPHAHLGVAPQLEIESNMSKHESSLSYLSIARQALSTQDAICTTPP